MSFDEHGNIAYVIDLTSNKNYVKPGRAFNEFELFVDIPVKHDAWDIDLYYRDKKINAKPKFNIEIISNGQLFVQLRIHGALGNMSYMYQDILFYAHTKRIDFKTKIEWNEQHTLLKIAFPLNIDIRSIDCDMQYGYITRDVKTDNAKFEFIAHKWVRGYDNFDSVAILTDSKYGWDYYDDAIRLSAATDPSRTAR